jgi:hypothetical protein
VPARPNVRAGSFTFTLFEFSTPADISTAGEVFIPHFRLIIAQTNDLVEG